MPPRRPTATKASKTELSDLLAKQQITDVLFRYCRGTDRGDADLLRTCFHPDSTHVMGQFEGLSHDYIESRIMALGRTLDYEMHFVTNIMIELQGDRAVSESLFLARHIWTDPKTKKLKTRVVEGRYLDRFERRKGVWKIAHRTGLMPFVQESDLPGPVTPKTLAMSGKFPDDLVYGLIASLKPKARAKARKATPAKQAAKKR
jgi:hypothetical protein